MITLRIQEVLQEQGLSFEELSNRLGLLQEDLTIYIDTQSVSLTKEVASTLKDIATVLRVPVVSLLKPIPGKEIFRLRILEIAQRRSIKLNELSRISQVPHIALVFYCTQPFFSPNLNKAPFDEHLKAIQMALNCTLQDLRYELEVPVAGKIAEFSESRGVSLEELSMLADLPVEFLEILSVQYPENFFVLTLREQPPICDFCCPVQYIIPCPPGTCNC